MRLHRHLVRHLDVTLMAFGAICFLWCGTVAVRAARFQRAQTLALECDGHCVQTANAPRAAERPAPAAAADPNLVGRLEIPRLGVSVVVMNGDDDQTLALAAGHLPDTPMPWEWGNSAVAAHRDTFFRPLKDLQPGDELRVVSLHGTFIYRVRETRVVSADEVSVLASGAQPSLTLLTCYPFYYMGSAPKRFVAAADLIASTPRTNEVR
jgi:sortase A